MGVHKDILAVLRDIERVGWTVEKTRRGHLKLRSPDGRRTVNASSTTRYPEQAKRDLLDDLERAGYRPGQRRRKPRKGTTTEPEVQVIHPRKEQQTMPGISYGIELITPRKAEGLLAKNTTNRRLRQTKIDQYAADMTAKNWSMTGEAIKVDSDGNLADGQHRLSACIQAGVSFSTMVVRGVDPEAQQDMDSGLPRTTGDVLAWRNEVDTMALAAALSQWYRLVTGQPTAGRGTRPTNTQMFELLDRNPSIRDRLKERTRYKDLGIPGSPMVAFTHMTRMAEPEFADDFLDRLATGLRQEPRTGDYVLRRWAINQRIGAKPDQVAYLAHMIKGWNLAVTDQQGVALSWRRRGSKREPFPGLLLSDGSEWEIRNELDDPVVASRRPVLAAAS